MISKHQAQRPTRCLEIPAMNEKMNNKQYDPPNNHIVIYVSLNHNYNFKIFIFVVQIIN